MSNSEIFNTKILRARIAQIEYGGPTQITVVYIEETGQEQPGEITLYHSNESKELTEA